MEFSGNTFAKICVHGRWKIGEGHSIHYKITLLAIWGGPLDILGGGGGGGG
jgi:hypothetical protein